VKAPKPTLARWKGETLEMGLSAKTGAMQVLGPLIAIAPLVWQGMRGEEEGLDLVWLLVALGGALLMVFLAARVVGKHTRSLLIAPVEVTWKGGRSHNLGPEPGELVRQPRSAVTKVWLHGPARKTKRSLWHTSVVLEGDGLPLDVPADVRTDREQALRIATELADRLGVPFEDRTG